jgi:hypothetical protein
MYFDLKSYENRIARAYLFLFNMYLLFSVQEFNPWIRYICTKHLESFFLLFFKNFKSGNRQSKWVSAKRRSIELLIHVQHDCYSCACFYSDL